MIILKSSEEIEKMRGANLLVRECLSQLREIIKPGITTYAIDRLAENFCRKKNCKPAFKGYKGFPGSVCVSINYEVVHGIPSKKRRLNQGDIISIDFGVIKSGYVGDSAITVGVGKISPDAQELIKVTREALAIGIAACKVGNRVKDIGRAIEPFVKKNSFSVVREFVGHGIGSNMHEEPAVPNYYDRSAGTKLHEGMVIAIEPMINQGTYEVDVLADGWTTVTRDRKLSAHFEHSVAITSNGPYVLSRL